LTLIVVAIPCQRLWQGIFLNFLLTTLSIASPQALFYEDIFPVFSFFDKQRLQKAFHNQYSGYIPIAGNRAAKSARRYGARAPRPPVRIFRINAMNLSAPSGEAKARAINRIHRPSRGGMVRPKKQCGIASLLLGWGMLRAWFCTGRWH